MSSKVLRLLAIIGILLMSNFSFAQIEPNSEVFVVDDYIYPDNAGNYVPYRSAVTIQKKTSIAAGVLTLLPNIYILKNDISYVDQNGIEVISIKPEVSIKKIVVTPSIDPNPDLKFVAPKIAKSVGLSQVRMNRYPLIVPTTGGVTAPKPSSVNKGFFSVAHTPETPIFHNQTPYWSQQATSEVFNGYSAMYTERAKVRNAYALFSGYNVKPSQIRSLEMILLVDGVVLSSRTLSGTSILTGGNLPTLSVDSPDNYTVNRINSGNFEIILNYKILDNRISSISAKLNAETIINSFVKETKLATTKSRSSGWKVLGIGSRKRRLKTAINESVESSSNINSVDNTQINMVDPTGSMVERFEKVFFPEVIKEDVIKTHIDAADKALSNGNPGLAQIHTDYAKALLNNEESLETDTAAAAAALASQDYLGFLAAGVRMSSSNTRKTDNFRRVVKSVTTIARDNGWADVLSLSAERQISMRVALEKNYTEKAYLGYCGTLTFKGSQPGDKLIMITCVDENGPLYNQAQIIPGMLISHVDGIKVDSEMDIANALATKSPGDRLSITYLSKVGFLKRLTSTTKNVELKSYLD